MNPNDQTKLDSDGTGGLDLEGIIIESSQSGDGAPNGTAPGDQMSTPAGNDLLEESGIEIIKNGRPIDLNDPDLI